MTLTALTPLRSLTHRAMLALGIVVSGCDNGVSTDADGPLMLSMADGASSGNNQRGMTGETLRDPLRVVVTRNGQPVAGVEVAWYTTYGSIVPSGPTDASGIASATWTLPPSLFGSREARVVLATAPTSSVGFRAQPSHPRFEILSGGGQIGVVGDLLEGELSARVTWDGLPLSGRAVQWFGGEVESTGATDANGIVRGRWRLGPIAGQQAVHLRLAPHASDGPQGVVGAAAMPGPAAAMSLLSAADSAGTWLRGRESNIRVSVRVRDKFGNAVPLAQVAWALSSSQGAPTAQVLVTTDQTGVGIGFVPVDAAIAQQDFTAEASLSGVAVVRQAFKVVDALMMDYGWGWYLDPQNLTVPVGTTVSWGNWTSSDHLLSVVTPLSDTTVAVVATIGSLWASPNRIVTHQFHTPGTYVVDCITPTHWWERMIIQVTP